MNTNALTSAPFNSPKVRIVLFVIVLSLSSRLIFINTNVFFFDGDEALMGLMALEVFNGEFPIFFYGQSYGFALIEVLAIAGGIATFGATLPAIKLPMLAIWTVSIIFMALTFHKILKRNEILTILFITVIILSPTWLVWSMKARSGYLTSFLCSTIIVYLLNRFDFHLKFNQWMVVGALSMIVFESQALWFPSTTILITYGLYRTMKESKIKGNSIGGLIIGGLLVYIPLYFAKIGLYDYWPRPTIDISNALDRIVEFPYFVLGGLGGNFYMNTVYEPSNRVYSVLFICFLLISLVVIIFKSTKSRLSSFSVPFAIAVPLALVGFFVESEIRYILPFYGFAILIMVLAYEHFSENSVNVVIKFFITILLISAVWSLTNFRTYSFINMSINTVDKKIVNDSQQLIAVITELRKKNIQYVFTTNELLQHQINYLSNQDILAVGKSKNCRTPWNRVKALAAYEENPMHFAVVSYNFSNKFNGLLPILGDKYVILERPPKAFLSDIGFF